MDWTVEIGGFPPWKHLDTSSAASSDVFNKFKNGQGSFNETLASDVQGLCSLYEASHLRTPEDDILEEACDFSKTKLESLEKQLSPSVAAQINHCLRRPLYKSVPRFETRHCMTLFEQDPSHNETLLIFAKVDFNLLQNLHKKEIGYITQWDISHIRSLPECMKVVFETVLQLCEEIELLTRENGKSSFVVPHFKQAFEQERVHVASAVECCMKQYGISEAEAYNLIHKDVEDCWKVINEECIRSSDDIIPKCVLDCVVNLARISEVSYENHEDKYTNADLLKDYVSSLLLDPVSIDQEKLTAI
ncbi:hypothetical protein VIGAN_07119300 [Vigna angularis var. angularis]|uniref:Uncharacterized protein n=1 Tax=Vigna angularis var. angularis TaxID=157739 RepID=A0A0S3SI28_PHAAN|nr:hypothetical protein VIGAN_07119300 [Vigna angularis var. angularis]